MPGTCVSIRSDLDVVEARRRGRELAAQLGFSSTDSTLIATSISELARNIIQYARSGEIVLEAIDRGKKRGILVMARDEGPGIADVSRALRGANSDSRSLGLGLSGVKRLMDEFEIVSQLGQGVKVTVRKWKNSTAP